MRLCTTFKYDILGKATKLGYIYYRFGMNYLMFDTRYKTIYSFDDAPINNVNLVKKETFLKLLKSIHLTFEL